MERHRGATVAQLGLDAVYEIYSLRTALERLAAESLCRNATPADFKHLAEVLGQFERASAHPDGGGQPRRGFPRRCLPGGPQRAPVPGVAVYEIYSLRTALERLAAESLCRNATPADFKHLAELLGQFDKLPRPLTRSAVASLDVAFHDGVYQAAHNDRLYQAWLALRSQIFLYLVHRGALRADFADSWLKDHEDYLEVLMRRKRVLAVKVVEAHIEGTYQRVLAANRAAGDGSNGRSRSVD